MSDTTTPADGLSQQGDPFEIDLDEVEAFADGADDWSFDPDDDGADDWSLDLDDGGDLVDPFDDGGFDLVLDVWDDGESDYGVAYDSATTCFDSTANGSETATSYDSGFDF